MEKFNTTGGSKNGKGGVFKSAAHKLLTVGGGNKTNLKCSGVNNNTGAAQLKNLTNFLFSCEASVHKVCNLTNFNKLANGTKLKACYKTATTFETLAQDCLDDVIDDSTDDACSCWQKKSLANATAAAKLCKFNKEAAAYGVALRHCRNAFAKCRKYEDAVSEIISVCTTSASSLKKSVAALHKNAAKVKKAKSVVKTLSTKTGRMKRSSPRSAVSCTEVHEVATTMLSLVSEFPEHPHILDHGEKIIASASLTCLSHEFDLLIQIETEMDAAIATLEAAVEAGQSQLAALTGSTASATELENFIEEVEIGADTTVAPVAADTTVAPVAADTTMAPAAADTTMAPVAAETTMAPVAAETTMAPVAADTTMAAGDTTHPHDHSDETTPAGGMSTPAGGMSTPTGDMSTPAGGMSTPTGDMSSPSGGDTAMTGATDTTVTGATDTTMTGATDTTVTGATDTTVTGATDTTVTGATDTTVTGATDTTTTGATDTTTTGTTTAA